VIIPGVVGTMVRTLLYSGMCRLVVDTYTSRFRRILICSSSDREVEAEYCFETFVALNQNAIRHVSGGTDLEELNILKSLI
jgi:hypothetical protein